MEHRARPVSGHRVPYLGHLTGQRCVEALLRAPRYCVAMRFWLIPVAGARHALDAFFQQWPDDEAPVNTEQLRQAVQLAFKFVPVSGALMDYARVGGKPTPN